MPARSDPSDEVQSFLPLPTAVFHILVALADRDRHGYSIMQDVSARTDGKVRLSAGTLYSAIRRMLEQGLIEELRDSPDPASDDERRRYYRLTRLRPDRGGGRSAAPQRHAEPGARDRTDSTKAVGMRAADVYRALLWCYPAQFRHEYGREMVGAFTEQLRDARHQAGRFASARRFGRARSSTSSPLLSGSMVT